MVVAVEDTTITDGTEVLEEDVVQDIMVPHMNGSELCEKILLIDIKARICFMSSLEINREGLKEIYPSLSLGCFMRKPVTIDYLIKRIMSELDSDLSV
jgi:response regulator RpfG family c-di-GMP phosphodiesterase